MELFLSTVNICVQNLIFPKLDLRILKRVGEEKREYPGEESREQK